jgi:pyruvate-formate lyase-activating enzyme
METYQNKKEMCPHIKNYCGGNYQNWLEVYLTKYCNGQCSWCIARDSENPDEELSYKELAKIIVEMKEKKNVILLGGEPTLYPYLPELIQLVREGGKNLYLTTNGSFLTPGYIKKNNLGLLTGINISIHHYEMNKNKEITGLSIKEDILKQSVAMLSKTIDSIRLNCNCIKGFIDSKEAIYRYIDFARSIGVNKIRFAELRDAESLFVNLGQIMEYAHGLNENPYELGCNQDVIIDGMHINFRQMCGYQTRERPKPIEQKKVIKNVLYYDGAVYDTWQIKDKEIPAWQIKDKEIPAPRVKNLRINCPAFDVHCRY